MLNIVTPRNIKILRRFCLWCSVHLVYGMHLVSIVCIQSVQCASRHLANFIGLNFRRYQYNLIILKFCNCDKNDIFYHLSCAVATENSQQPTALKDDPVYFTVNSIQQQTLTMSADHTYSTVDEDNQKIFFIQDNPAYFTSTTNNQPQVALSSNPAYGALCKDSQEPAMQDKSIFLMTTSRSVLYITEHDWN